MSSAAARRGPLLLLGAVALMTGLLTGLARVGAVVTPLPAMAHGPLMVSAFLGTVISLERAVASRQTWAYLGPIACGLGGLLMLSGHFTPGAVAVTLGSLIVTLVLARVTFQAPELHHAVLWLAATCWLTGNALLAAGRAVFEVVPLWLVFLVGTIAAERLELTRVLPRSRRTVQLFIVALGAVVLGAVSSLWALAFGWRLLGVGAVSLAVWLLRHDVARRTVRQSGLTRFIAVALLGGYGWLLIGGALAAWFGFLPAGPAYDAELHALLVGFVFAMIFGHAPIIVPAVLGVQVPYAPRFYVHLAVLHASVALRLAGDVLELHELRKLGAWGNALAIGLFLISTFVAATLSARATAPRPATIPAPVRAGRPC